MPGRLVYHGGVVGDGVDGEGCAADGSGVRLAVRPFKRSYADSRSKTVSYALPTAELRII